MLIIDLGNNNLMSLLTLINIIYVSSVIVNSLIMNFDYLMSTILRIKNKFILN